MKRLKVIVVGAKFGEVYLQVLLRRKDLVDVVGILGKGGQHSLECSTKYNIPLYTSVSELPSGIDLACVIVRAGVMGGEGIQLSKELLQKGISVLHEQPIHYKELKECYVIAKKQKCFMGVSNLYRYIDATQSFIDLVNHLKKEEYVEYINVECGHQILYSVLSILFDLTDYARPFVIEQVITDIGPFDILYCRINDIPCILKIHNEVNSDDPDNFFYLFYKMQVGFKSGELQLEDPAVLYLYNEFKKEIPSRSIQYLPDEYINLKKILLKLDCMEKRQRFELYSKMALEKAENQFPVDMCIDLFAAYKQSFKAAQFVPEVYAGNIRFLLAEESTSFIPDNDEETLAFWKNTCLDDMSVEMIKGNHITCTENKENACTLCKKISKCFQD